MDRPLSLFRTGEFPLAGGARSGWKIDCDALTPEDWCGLARMASEILPPFGVVEGVPRGGLAFADALRAYTSPGCPTLLIADDVVTTGGSMERFRAGRDAVGVAVFCRGSCPEWCRPVFRMTVWAGTASVDACRVRVPQLEAELSAARRHNAELQRRLDDAAPFERKPAWVPSLQERSED